MTKRFPLHSKIEVIVKDIAEKRISLTLPEVLEAEQEKNIVHDYKDEASESFGNLDNVFGNLKF